MNIYLVWAYLVWSDRADGPWLESIHSTQEKAITEALAQYKKPDNWSSWYVMQAKVDGLMSENVRVWDSEVNTP